MENTTAISLYEIIIISFHKLNPAVRHRSNRPFPVLFVNLLIIVYHYFMSACKSISGLQRPGPIYIGPPQLQFQAQCVFLSIC